MEWYTPPMLARLLRGLAYVAYCFVLVLVFGLAAYTSFSLFVRSGITMMPSVKGLTRDEAANRLADQGLELRQVKEQGRYDDEIPAGRVVQQVPDARTRVKRGSGVSVVLSLGPERVIVPDLTGRRLADAQFDLSRSGLALGRIQGAVLRGQKLAVVAQDPDPQAAVAPSTPVNMLLVMDVPRDRYIMPDLIYRNYDQVRPFFERRGFHFGSVRFERYEGVAAGIILRQYPLPGHPVAQDDALSLVVATTDNLPETLPFPVTPPPAAPPPAGGTP